MYVDHRTATAVQARRAAELQRIVALRRLQEDVRTPPATQPAPTGFWAAAFARLRPRSA